MCPKIYPHLFISSDAGSEDSPEILNAYLSS